MSAFYNVKNMLVQMLAVSTLLLITMTSARGHEVGATVGDLSSHNFIHFGVCPINSN